MIKYYTRACNFYHGQQARLLHKRKLALPLCGDKNIVFDTLEIIIRRNGKIVSKYIHFKSIKKLSYKEKKIVNKDLKKITSKRKNFLKHLNFNSPSIMGILNLTPDSFSDGGRFNTKKKSFEQISKMIKSGADIIDVGGESTRPGSKTVKPEKEWQRIQYVIKNFKKKYKNICLSIDTRKSDLMVKSIKFGADIINDVSGFEYDKNSAEKIRKFNTCKILHHMCL